MYTLTSIDFILILKYCVAALIVFVITIAPAWIAAYTGKDKLPSGIVRTASWLFGWTIIGWLVGLMFASRK